MDAKIEKYIMENYFTDAWIDQDFGAGMKESSRDIIGKLIKEGADKTFAGEQW